MLPSTVARRANSRRSHKEQQYEDMHDRLRHGGAVFGEAIGTRGGAVQPSTVDIEKSNRCNATLVECHNHFKVPQIDLFARLRSPGHYRFLRSVDRLVEMLGWNLLIIPFKIQIVLYWVYSILTHRSEVSNSVAANTDVFDAFRTNTD